MFLFHEALLLEVSLQVCSYAPPPPSPCYCGVSGNVCSILVTSCNPHAAGHQKWTEFNFLPFCVCQFGSGQDRAGSPGKSCSAGFDCNEHISAKTWPSHSPASPALPMNGRLRGRTKIPANLRRRRGFCRPAGGFQRTELQKM